MTIITPEIKDRVLADLLSAETPSFAIDYRDSKTEYGIDSPYVKLRLDINRMFHKVLNVLAAEHNVPGSSGKEARMISDLMLKRSLKKCVDWSCVDKKEYMEAMRESVNDADN